MGELKKFIVVTEEIITCATNVKQETRDQDIAKINELLDQLEDILAKIIPPFSKDELNLCEQLPAMNKRLEDAMTALQAMIQKDLQEVGTKKSTFMKYVNPYEATQTHDGAFYDKRK